MSIRPASVAVGLDAVEVGVVEDAGEVDGRAVREVAAVGEVEPEEAVAGLHQGEVDGVVGRGAGVRLHVHPVGAEELLRPLLREVFGLVHDLAPAVVPLAGPALGVLVRQRRAHRLQHGERDEVLRSDEFDPVVLPVDFALDDGEEVGVLRAEILHKGQRAKRLVQMRRAASVRVYGEAGEAISRGWRGVGSRRTAWRCRRISTPRPRARARRNLRYTRSPRGSYRGRRSDG